MSVDVKTPTELPQFELGGKDARVPTVTVTGSTGGPAVTVSHPGRPSFHRQSSENIGQRHSRKRRFSERAGGADWGNRERYLGAPGFKRNRFTRGGKFGQSQEKIVLPTKFFLGGNINDPLNLNSLSDETINKALNENTPKSSPLAIPKHRQEVHVIIPPNIQDPLGLTSGDDVLLLSPKSMGKKRQRKNKHKRKNQAGDKSEVTDASLEVSQASSMNDSKALHIDITSDSEVNYTHGQQNDSLDRSKTDEPVTPGEEGALNTSNISTSELQHNDKKNDSVNTSVGALPQLISPRGRRRKRNSSECKSEGRSSVDSERSGKSDKTSPHRSKYLKRQQSHTSSTQSGPYTPLTNRAAAKPKPRRRKHGKQFIYGNYNRYYGYRNPDKDTEKDARLLNMNHAWFKGKDVLDIGCNVGHVTLSIAKDFCPRKIVGMDIDSGLVTAAKRNIRHYLTSKVTNTAKYPSSLMASFGPIAAPPVTGGTSSDSDDQQQQQQQSPPPPAFPNNVIFLAGNYVLESEELVDMTREEYDVILALSVTKWVHLNWGDAGLKRMFRRMYKQLRPGGKLILEPQLWPSYKKRKKLTEAHSMNYAQIQLRPEQFREYLLTEVGFSKCEQLEVPFNKAKGFLRPLLVFSKSDTTQPCSRVTTPGQQSDTWSRGATPRFQVGGSWSETTSPTTMGDEDHSNTSNFTPATTPGYNMMDSPRCAIATSAVTGTCTDQLSSVQEEEEEDIAVEAAMLIEPPLRESTPIGNRPLTASMRSSSAPCLMETSALLELDGTDGNQEERRQQQQGPDGEDDATATTGPGVENNLDNSEVVVDSTTTTSSTDIAATITGQIGHVEDATARHSNTASTAASAHSPPSGAHNNSPPNADTDRCMQTDMNNTVEAQSK